MKLYYSRGACSLAVRIILNELKITAEYEAVDLAAKKTENNNDYYQINAKGSVPALELANGEILTENAVILQYLADTHNATHLLPAVTDLKRYRVLEMLNFVATELHKGFGPFFSQAIDASLKDNIFKPALKRKFDFIETKLGSNKFIMGEQFTLPDAYLLVVLRWHAHFHLGLESYTNLPRYFNNLKNYPAIAQALQDEKLS